MKLVTKQERIDGVAKHWKYSYFESKGNSWMMYGPDKEEIYNKLLALNPLTEVGINETIGNASWTSLNCDECGVDSDALVRIEDCESWLSLCRFCLAKATEKIEAFFRGERSDS